MHVTFWGPMNILMEDSPLHSDCYQVKRYHSIQMALPRYLYSVSDSVEDPLLTKSETATSTSPGKAAQRGFENPYVARIMSKRDSSSSTESDVENPSYERERELGGAIEIKGDTGDDVELSASAAATNVENGLNLHQYRQSNAASVVKRDSTLASKTGTRDSRTSQFTDPGDEVFYKDDKERTKWEEAALYVREGEDNAKFYHHPRGKWSKMAFKVLHHPVYYVCHLIVSVLLMLLAFIEDPRIGNNQLTDEQKKAILSVHGVFEIFLLSFLSADILLRFCWFRARQFFHHKRTLFIMLILTVMYLEALVVLGRQQSHIRVTRALRPFFFIDNYLMVGVRRVLRQIFLCIKPISDILVLLLFFVTLFSLLGYYIFADVDPDYFYDFKRTFVSLFITLTTANHPDVMMEAYQEKPASPIFFIVYVFLTLYFISNILLAVVYSSFSEADKNKFKKLFLHKRDALRLAYSVLAGTSKGIEFHDFLLFMKEYRPRMPEWQAMCIFKALHTNPQQQHQDLSLNEFYGFYEVRDFNWNQVSKDGVMVPWFEYFSPKLRAPVKSIHKLVKWRWFNIIINLIVLVNVLFLVIYTIVINDPAERFQKLHIVLPVSFVFTVFYALEIMIKIIGLGPYDFFRKIWNVLDTLVIVVSLICLAFEVHSAFIFVATARPIKLIRLIRLKRRYRDIMDTILVLLPRLSSVLFLLVVIYYFFAIIGMEFLFGRVGPGCCNGSWYGVSQYYDGARLNGTNSLLPSPDVYYLNNFDNILRSYVTLFILMVVNNWYIIMEGFASEVRYDWLGRLYFMSFYTITLVVLQVAISFIVEAFVFKIQATERSRLCLRHKSTECGCELESENKKRVLITLVAEDIIKLKYEVAYMKQAKQRWNVDSSIRSFRRVDMEKLPNTLCYVGRRRRTKEDIHLLMYKSVLLEWIRDMERKKTIQESVGYNKPKVPKWQIVVKKIADFLEYIIE